jgi:hypothetical protein
LSKVGSLTAFVAEASLWLAGAAIVAGAAGAHWNMPSVDLGALIAESSPGPSPSPGAPSSQAGGSPSASSAPSPIVQKFKAYLAGPAVQFEASFTIKSSTENGSIITTQTGTLQYAAGDEADTLTTTTNTGIDRTSDNVYLGNFTFRRAGGGNWTRTARKATDTGQFVVMLSPENSYVDLGVDTKYEVQAHLLQVADQTALDASFREQDGAPAGTSASLLFWVRDDGTPVGWKMHLTYTQSVNGGPTFLTWDQESRITKTSGVVITAPKI